MKSQIFIGLSSRVVKTPKHKIFLYYRNRSHENLLNWFTSRLLYFMLDRILGYKRRTHGLNCLKITFPSSQHKFISFLVMEFLISLLSAACTQFYEKDGDLKRSQKNFYSEGKIYCKKFAINHAHRQLKNISWKIDFFFVA